MIYRVATAKDEEALRRLHTLAWKDYEAGSEMPSWDTPGTAEMVILPFMETGQMVVAEDKGQVVGMVAVARFDKWWMLMNIVVDEDYRGNGVAKGMVKLADEIGISLGGKEGYIWAPNRLARFYTDGGYKPVGQIMVKNA